MSSNPNKTAEPRREKPKFEEFQVPEIGVSPLTGLPGNPLWGAINKPSQFSRWAIGDADSDDEFNWLPMGGHKLQIPGQGTTIATLAAGAIWLTSFYFNGGTFLFALASNGNVYQISAAGVVTTVGTGFTTTGIVDIACWQGTTLILSDSAAQKIFSWNGTTLTTVFTAQPVQYIAVFQNRLWMAINSTIQWTNVNTFNSLLGDSGSYLITDSGSTNPINGMVDTPYGLLVSGANWFKTITNLVDVGVPAVLTFQQNTIESQVGILNKWSILVVGNTVFFANSAGIWAFQGSQPIQISAPFLNGFFSNLDFTKTNLAGAYGIINSVPCVFFQAYYKGDTQVSAGYTIFGYTLQGTQWFRYVGGTLVWITGLVSQTSTNNNPIIWATDGTNIFTLFTNTSTVLNSQWNGKLWTLGSFLDIDNVLSVAIEFIVNSAATITVSYNDEGNDIDVTLPAQIITPGSLTWVNNTGQPIQFVNNSGANINFTSNVTSLYFLFQANGLFRVRRFGLNVTVNGAACALLGVTLSMHRTGASVGS